jgi:hypothetical protein
MGCRFSTGSRQETYNCYVQQPAIDAMERALLFFEEKRKGDARFSYDNTAYPAVFYPYGLPTPETEKIEFHVSKTHPSSDDAARKKVEYYHGRQDWRETTGSRCEIFKILMEAHCQKKYPQLKPVIDCNEITSHFVLQVTLDQPVIINSQRIFKD